MNLTPEQQQEAYRAKCTHARKGSLIIELETGAKRDHKDVNKAKRWVRENAPFKTYRIS